MDRPEGDGVRNQSLNQQKNVSYRDLKSLIKLKNWFYNHTTSNDQRYRAIQRVKAFASRGRLPHGVEITSLLISIRISDPIDKSKFPKQHDASLLQLSYSMALIRFVNGLLDPLQQGNFAISLHSLARNIELPSFFVELRHMGTHEQIPSLEVLRLATDKALDWLFENYWSEIEAKNGADLKNGDGDIEPEEDLDQNRDRVISILKAYKRIRKQNLDQIHDKTSNSGSKYWKTINYLLGYSQSNTKTLINILMTENFLIYNRDKLNDSKKLKFNPLLFKLYKPLLDELGPGFKDSLLGDLFSNLQTSNSNTETCFALRDERELAQSEDWITFLISDLAEGSSALLENRTRAIGNLDSSIQSKYLPIVEKALLDQPRNNEVEKILTFISSKTSPNNPTVFTVPPSLDEILNASKRKAHDNSGPSKKLQPTPTKQKQHFLFEEHDFWIPTPFGINP